MSRRELCHFRAKSRRLSFFAGPNFSDTAADITGLPTVTATPPIELGRLNNDLLPPRTPMFRDVNTLTFRQILRPTQ